MGLEVAIAHASRPWFLALKAGAVGWLICAPTASPGQQNDIVVTGRGLGEGRGDAAYDVTVIDRDRLMSSSSNRLEDLLRDVAGFQQFRRSDARSANPTSQGASFRGLGGNASSRALVLLDGVPQADPFGGWIAWPALDPRRLGAVRVVRGGGTGARGPGALAGTIDLESAAPDDVRGIAIDAALGSRDGMDLFAGYGADAGNGFFTLSGAYARGDGFVPVVARQSGAADRPAPYEQASLAARAVFPALEGAELQAGLSGFTDSRERGTAFSDIRSRGADAALRLVGQGRVPFSALAYVQVRQFSNRFAAVDAARAAATQTLDQYSVPSTGLGARFEARPITGPLELRVGADWREVEGRTRELFQFVGGRATRARVAGGRTRTLGAFAEASLTTGALTLTAGARLDHWRILDGRLVERLLAGPLITEPGFAARDGWAPTGRTGATWRLGEMVTLRAAAYRGWRLPTLNELYRPFRVGIDGTAANAGLAPETLNGIEAGLELRPAAAVRASLTLFANRMDDAIGNVTLGQGPGTFPGVGFIAAGGAFRRRENVDAIVSRGVEVDASIAHGPWRAELGYGFAASKVRATGSAAALNGLRPAQTPRHNMTASLLWRGDGGRSLSFGLRYVSSQFEDDLNRQRLPDALTFHAFAAFPLTRTLLLEVRGENLTDEEVVAGISSAGIVERATPRTIWLGVRWHG